MAPRPDRRARCRSTNSGRIRRCGRRHDRHRQRRCRCSMRQLCARLAKAATHAPLLVDFGLPPNIDPAAARGAGLERIGMDELIEAAQEQRIAQLMRLAPVRAAIDERLARLRGQLAARGIGKQLAELREAFERIAGVEMDRLLDAGAAGAERRAKGATAAICDDNSAPARAPAACRHARGRRACQRRDGRGVLSRGAAAARYGETSADIGERRSRHHDCEGRLRRAPPRSTSAPAA